MATTQTLLIVLAVTAVIGLLALIACFLDWFFGDAIPSGSTYGVLSLTDSELDSIFEGEAS